MPVNKQFLVFNLGVFLAFSGVYATVALVSSMNVKDGLGTSSLAVAFGSSIVSAFIIPVLIKRLGCRFVILFAEFGYLCFVICNIKSISYNLIIGGIFYGVGEAGVWTAYPTVASKFASKHSSIGSKTEETYKNHYIGYLFAGVQASLQVKTLGSQLTGYVFNVNNGSVKIFGNAAGFLILYVDRLLSNRLNVSKNLNYSVCAANDCQDGDITSANLEQYTPAYDATRYIVVSIFSLFVCTAMILHFCFLPHDKPVHNSSPITLKNGHQQDDAAIELVHQCHDNKGACDVKVTLDNNKKSGLSDLKSTVTQSLKLFFTIKHLLVVLLPIYSGLTIGFIMGELTRSYASCILGLDKVAVGAMLFGLGDTLLSYVSGKVAGKYGRNGPYVVAFLLDIANYLFCLFWSVDHDNVWLVYLLFFSFGITDGIWQTLINVMYEEYFAVQREIAFNLWNVIVNIGTFIQFFISVYLCVYQKIYIQITVICLAMLLYGISQIVYYRRFSLRRADNPLETDKD